MERTIKRNIFDYQPDHTSSSLIKKIERKEKIIKYFSLVLGIGITLIVFIYLLGVTAKI